MSLNMFSCNSELNTSFKSTLKIVLVAFKCNIFKTVNIVLYCVYAIVILVHINENNEISFLRLFGEQRGLLLVLMLKSLELLAYSGCLIEIMGLFVSYFA